VVEKVELVQVFLGVLCFSLSVSFHRGFPCSYITWELKYRPVCGRSSETYSHLIHINNTPATPSIQLDNLSRTTNASCKTADIQPISKIGNFVFRHRSTNNNIAKQIIIKIIITNKYISRVSSSSYGSTAQFGLWHPL
jgi:hypothetical protein